MFLNEKFIVSFDTAEDVAVSLPVLNTEINVMCNPSLPGLSRVTLVTLI